MCTFFLRAPSNAENSTAGMIFTLCLIPSTDERDSEAKLSWSVMARQPTPSRPACIMTSDIPSEPSDIVV